MSRDSENIVRQWEEQQKMRKQAQVDPMMNLIKAIIKPQPKPKKAPKKKK